MRMGESLKRPFRFLLLTNKSFRLFRWFGVHVSPVHFYSPIPDLRELPPDGSPWARPSALPGVEMNAENQRRLLTDVLARFQPECDFPFACSGRPGEFHVDNVYFGYGSAVAMHSMIRHTRPRRVVEIGAGYSSVVIARALRMNAADGSAAEFTAIDPFPSPVLSGGVPGISRVVQSRVQDLGLDSFAGLRAGDLVSIDSSHAVRTGGDVPFLYLEVLPWLAPGVLVHIHDIFLPEDYPRSWLERRFFWSEQYLVQAFLVFNRGFEVIFAQRFAELTFPQEYAAAMGGRVSAAENFDSYSLWLRRTEEAPSR